MKPQAPHHPISASVNGGAGKTATNRRRWRFNPYGRPPPQAPPPTPPPPPKSPSWILSGAAKIISSIFISDSSSDSSSDEEEFISDDNVNCNNGHDGRPNGTNGSNLDSENLLQGCTSKELGSEVDETGRKHVIKQLLLQETFSREECDKLVKLINSRVLEHSTVDGGKMVDSALTPGSRVLNVTPDHAVMEARKFLEEKKAGRSPQSDFGHGNSSLYSTMIQHIESEAGSAADMAKSYMRARPPWASPSTEHFELRTPSTMLTRLTSEEKLHPVSHLKERNYLSSGAWSMQDEIRKVRSKATEDMIRPLSSSKDTNFSSRNGSKYAELKHRGLPQHSETQKANGVTPSPASLSRDGLIGETQPHTIEDNAAQKNFNHLRNDHEIVLDNTSTIQPCFEDDDVIPKQQFCFRSIRDLESIDNNSIVDVIGVVCSVCPSTSLMRKNGTETQKRTLQLKDMSGVSVEFTLWGNFCNAEGCTLQTICDSGGYPILAVKSGRVNDFNGKTVGTISSTQLFIDPDYPEAHNLKAWFENDGKNAPLISLSKEMSMGFNEVRKTIFQIKDEKLGTSEKPDWITVCATPIFIKGDNFCYSACPLMIGDRKCHKKVTNNGDGKWRCERCEQDVTECDYRYILQMQIQDHTALTYVTAFDECGEEILGMPAKDLYLLKYEQDEDKYAEIVSGALYMKYIFKLKVKEESYNDEQRVKCTIVKADKVNFISDTRKLLASIANPNEQNLSSLHVRSDGLSSAAPVNSGYGSVIQQTSSTARNYIGNSSIVREGITSTNPACPYGNYAAVSRPAASPFTGMHLSCTSCGGSGHSSTNCPSIMNTQGQSYGGNVGIRDIPPAYGNNNVSPERYGNYSREHVGRF